MNTGIMLACCVVAVTLHRSSIAESSTSNHVQVSDTLVNPQRLGLENPSGGTFSHNTSLGKIFLQFPDKMPCLVPDTKSLSPIPVYRPKMRFFHMPNTLPVDTIGQHKKIP